MNRDELIATAMGVLDEFITALNARDEDGINASFNFPHVRLTGGGKVLILETYGDYKFAYFDERTKADGWNYSAWDRRDIVSVGPNKVHIDVQFSRYRGDDSKISTFSSFYIVTSQDGHWGIQARSSYAE